MINDTIKVTGELKITVTKPDGNVHETVVPNIVVTDGKEYIASRMKDASATAMSHMAIGTGSTAAAAGDAVSAMLLFVTVLAVASTTLAVSVRPFVTPKVFICSEAVTGSGSTSASDKSKSILEVNAFTFDCTAVTESFGSATVKLLAVVSVTDTVSVSAVVTSIRSIASEVVAVSVTFLWGRN